MHFCQTKESFAFISGSEIKFQCSRSNVLSVIICEMVRFHSFCPSMVLFQTENESENFKKYSKRMFIIVCHAFKRMSCAHSKAHRNTIVKNCFSILDLQMHFELIQLRICAREIVLTSGMVECWRLDDWL